METASKDEATNEIPKVKKVPRTTEFQPNVSQVTDALSVLAVTALTTSHITQPNNPPKSLPDLVTETVDEVDCPCTEDTKEMPHLEDIEP